MEENTLNYIDTLEENYLKNNSFSFIGEHHARIKQVKSILSNTKPNPNRYFIAEGLWSQWKVIEFDTPLDCIIVCPDFIKTPEAFKALKDITAKTENRFAVSQKVFEKISERDKPDGLIAVAQLPKFSASDIKLTDKSIILVLDGIEIPGNVGTMLRMCDGAGIDAVFIANKKARMTHPKLIKGSMGAVLSVPTVEFSSVNECMMWLKNNGFFVYLADTRADHHYYDEPFGKRTALVMGSERYGISREWYTEDDRTIMISIPMKGKCDSLNVGVAATVLCYEAAKKNNIL